VSDLKTQGKKMNEFCENHCMKCEHGEPWGEDTSFSHHFGIERGMETHITCNHDNGSEDPTGAWACPLMIAAHEVNVAKGETDCPITCEHIGYYIEEIIEGEPLTYCHRRKGECTHKLKIGA